MRVFKVTKQRSSPDRNKQTAALRERELTGNEERRERKGESLWSGVKVRKL